MDYTPINSENDVKVDKSNLKLRKVLTLTLLAAVLSLFLVIQRITSNTNDLLCRIFIPLFLYEITDIVYNKSDDNLKYPLVSLVVLFLQIPDRFAKIFLKYSPILFKIIEDFMIYFFVFICCYNLCIFILL